MASLLVAYAYFLNCLERGVDKRERVRISCATSVKNLTFLLIQLLLLANGKQTLALTQLALFVIAIPLEPKGKGHYRQHNIYKVGPQRAPPRRTDHQPELARGYLPVTLGLDTKTVTPGGRFANDTWLSAM